MRLTVLVVENRARLFVMMRSEVPVNELSVFTLLVHLVVDVLWRQPHEAQHGGYCQPHSRPGRGGAVSFHDRVVVSPSIPYFATMLKLRRPMGSPSRVAVTVTFQVPAIDNCPMP